MANKRFWLGILVMVSVFGITVAGCGSGGSGGGGAQTGTYTGKTADNETYTLKITGSGRAAFSPQTGDSYELTAGSKKSTGTVDKVAGGVLTLKPSNSEEKFNVTVTSSGGITAISGTITWSDNKTETAPGALSPSGGNSGGSDLRSTLVGYWVSTIKIRCYVGFYESDGTYWFSYSSVGTGDRRVMSSYDGTTVVLSEGRTFTAKVKGDELTIDGFNDFMFGNFSGTYKREE